MSGASVSRTMACTTARALRLRWSTSRASSSRASSARLRSVMSCRDTPMPPSVIGVMRISTVLSGRHREGLSNAAFLRWSMARRQTISNGVPTPCGNTSHMSLPSTSRRETPK